VPLDLGTITVDSYVVAGTTDHITPWESCYRSAQLFGGHHPIRAVHQRAHRRSGQPAGNPKASFHSGDDLTSDAEAWPPGADAHQGSWWTDLGRWLDEHLGAQHPAPTGLGSNRFGALAEAPGVYVFDK
jgi:polyhydroxyalkanoate synthase